jgi:hypothetical protein
MPCYCLRRVHSFEHEKLLINKLVTFGQSWYNTFNRQAMVHWINLKLCTYTAALSVQNLNCTWAGITHYGLFLAFQRSWYEKIQKKGCFFLCIIFYQIYCVIFSYIPFTFPQTSKCFLSNGTKNMHILASESELHTVRFGYVILGKNWKKGADP